MRGRVRANGEVLSLKYDGRMGNSEIRLRLSQVLLLGADATTVGREKRIPENTNRQIPHYGESERERECLQGSNIQNSTGFSCHAHIDISLREARHTDIFLRRRRRSREMYICGHPHTLRGL